MIAIYCDKELDYFQKEIRYTFDFLFSSMGYEHKYINSIEQLNNNDILVFYSLKKPSVEEAYVLAFNKIMFHIPVQPELLKPGFWKHDDIVKYKKKVKLTKPVSILCKQDFESPVGYYLDKELVYGMFHFDLVGLLFFHLSQYEDFSFRGRDEHNRIPDDAYSFIDDTNFPFANELLNLFDKFIQSAIADKPGSFIVKKENWPHAEKMAVCISHNVDKLQKWSLGKIFNSFFEDLVLIYKFGYVFKNFLNKMKYILTNVEEYWNFGLIAEIEKRFRIKSTYFWGVVSNHLHDVDYDLNDEDTLDELKAILKQGNEIALLASYESAKNDVIKKEMIALRKLLKQDEIGVRQMKYRFDSSRTPEFHRKNNAAYDASISLYERNGFKNGLALPFYFFQNQPRDATSDRTTTNQSFQTNLEIPLHFRDESLILSKFKQVSYEQAKEIIDELITNTELVNGLATFDFSLANFAEIPYLKNLYIHLIKIIQNKKCYIPTMLELSNWWKKRRAVILRETANSIYLHFPKALDSFAISILGQVEVQDIHGAKAIISQEKIIFEDIAKETTVRIKIKPIS